VFDIHPFLPYTPLIEIDLDLNRHEASVSTNPLVHTATFRRASLVRLSALDISPAYPHVSYR
jgi:hypothetical protein